MVETTPPTTEQVKVYIVGGGTGLANFHERSVMASFQRTIPIKFPLRINLPGLEEVTRDLEKDFGKSTFSVTYADGTTASFDSFAELAAKGIPTRILSLTISAGNGDARLYFDHRRPRLEITTDDEQTLTRVPDVILRRLRGMLHSVASLRGTVARVIVTVILTLAVWVAIAYLFTVRYHMPGAAQAMGQALATAFAFWFWGVYRRALPIIEFEFGGSDAGSQRWANRIEGLLVSFFASLLFYAVSKALDWP